MLLADLRVIMGMITILSKETEKRKIELRSETNQHRGGWRELDKGSSEGNQVLQVERSFQSYK